MRYYLTFNEAINEIRRELKEMGIQVHTKSVQNMDITNNSDYDAMELQNYIYTVLQPDWKSIELKVPEWGDAEFQERTGGKKLNPGKAWKLRSSYWEQFLVPKDYPVEDRAFDYAYPDRMTDPLRHVIQALRRDPSTRRAFLPIFDRSWDHQDHFSVRIPCSLGYHFMYRQGKLNVTYLLRSSDFGEHFNYDIYLADRLKCFVAEKCSMEPGTFTHWIGSLHVFAKDVKDVF